MHVVLACVENLGVSALFCDFYNENLLVSRLKRVGKCYSDIMNPVQYDLDTSGGLMEVGTFVQSEVYPSRIRAKKSIRSPF